jgi:hypothetical protein
MYWYSNSGTYTQRRNFLVQAPQMGRYRVARELTSVGESPQRDRPSNTSSAG